MGEERSATLERIHEAAKKWKVSERRISQYCTQGRIPGAQKFGRSWAIPEDAKKPDFAALPPEEQPENLGDISGACMLEMLRYAYDNLEEFKLILCCSEGTRFAGMADEMAEIETKATHDYQDILEGLGRPSPRIDPRLEHILITGMFNAFFELIIHEMPLHEAENYLAEMRAFYTAGWMKIMGQ